VSTFRALTRVLTRGLTPTPTIGLEICGLLGSTTRNCVLTATDSSVNANAP